MKASRVIAPAVLALSGMVAAYQASAQGFYIGGSVGKSDYSDEVAIPDLITSGTVDGKDTGFKLYGGYQFNQYFGVELAYVDLGKATYSGMFEGFPVTGGSVEVWGVNASAVGTLPLHPSFALFGKVGAFGWSGKARETTPGAPFSEEDASGDISFGLGFSFNFTKNFSARAEWERFNVRSADVELLSIGLVYKF